MVLEEQRAVDEIVVSFEARYPTDEEEQAETKGWTAFDYLPSPGIWVALATFIPTFLAVVIGVPHVLTSALAPHAIEPRVPGDVDRAERAEIKVLGAAAAVSHEVDFEKPGAGVVPLGEGAEGI